MPATSKKRLHFEIGHRHNGILMNRDIYTTALLPGFELPLGKLLAVCDVWKTKAKKKKKS
jgi:hypothetical protein